MKTSRWLDALALICLGTSLAAALAPSRVRLDLGFSVVSLGTWWRPLLLAILLAAVRHWGMPRPHLGERIVAWLRGLRTPPVVLSARMLLTTRVPVLLVGYAATLIIGLPPSGIPTVSEDPLANLPARWDATWYMEIARAGYRYDARLGPDDQQSIVFFPLYPMLMRTVAAFTTPERGRMTFDEHYETRQVRRVWSGLFISLFAFACALVVVYRWAELHGGPEAAAATVVLLATYPFAVFFSAPYTEGLYLLLAAGACYAFEQRRLPLAGVAGLLAGLTRPNAVMLSLVLGILALAPLRQRERGWVRRTASGLLAAAMPAVGLLVYCAFIYRLTGNPFTWIAAQAAWGRNADATAAHYAWMWRTIVDDGLLAYIHAAPTEAVQVVAVVFSLALVWPVWRRIGAAYAVFILANVLPPLIQGGVLSLGRFTATLFPQFLALALLVPPERRTSWIITFAIGQGLIASVFFTWRLIY